MSAQHSHAAELKIAFDINTSGDDVTIHPEMFSKQ